LGVTSTRSARIAIVGFIEDSALAPFSSGVLPRVNVYIGNL
jgi:hypothetical protein